MAKYEVHLELILGQKVYALNGRSIGRLEEVRANADGQTCVVTDFLVGSYAITERLSAWIIGRAILRVFGARQKGGYRIRWNQLDVSDSTHLRLLCKTSELLTFYEDEKSDQSRPQETGSES